MTKAADSTSRASAREARKERLAVALKANLRRRKAQARERATEEQGEGRTSGSPGQDNETPATTGTPDRGS